MQDLGSLAACCRTPKGHQGLVLCWVIPRAPARQRSALGHGPSVTGALVVFVEVGKSEGWRTECSGQPGEKCCSLDLCLLERYTKINMDSQVWSLLTEAQHRCVSFLSTCHKSAQQSWCITPVSALGLIRQNQGGRQAVSSSGSWTGEGAAPIPLHHWQRQHPCSSSLRCLLSHCSQQ